MVLSVSLPRGWSLVDDGVRLDRATGMGLAIAVNVLLLALLSLPRDAPFAPPPPTPVEKAEPIEVVVVPRAVAVAPSLPAAVPRVERQRPRIEAPRPAVPAPVVENPVLPLPPIEAAAPGEADPAATTNASAGGALMQLRVLEAPPPRYPPVAVREGREGTVVLRVLVGSDGRALRVEVEQGSGHRILDTAARTQVLARWRFEPALREGRAVEAWARVPVAFSLREG